ncbi:inactive hydroxysteroid dehydrogenase-like protein 1 [Styela clava]|uniref:inactive hydroxysteroid dehydrogenase-like protein 1 n=1 Tax=Styela clava TaxID=7725 RepID=UPI00193A872D|nr:inactive hydroxysteroid dehydrogenase-like protein 1 [Styela clava]
MAAVDSFSFLINQIAQVGRENWDYFIDIVAIVGAWYALRFTAEFGYHTFVHYRRAVFSARNFVKHYGRWAVVTGCTSGIGKQFCRQLAERGVNIVLIGRNSELCAKESRYLEKRYGVHTFTIIHDFCTASADQYAGITDILKDKEIGILINNAGVHYDHPMYFTEVDPERLYAITQVNMTGLVMLTHAIVPSMIARRKGLIVNLSSGAGWLPVPLITLYSASKAFVSHFSKSLGMELKQHNIHIQSLEPMYISTRMSKFSSLLSSTSPNAKIYVKNALKSFGKVRHGTGHYPHTIQMLIIRWCPHWLAVRASAILQHHLHSEGSQKKLKKE